MPRLDSCLLLLTSVVICRVTEAAQVIGGNRTAVQGQNVSLPCRLTETHEDISQISWQKATRENPVNHNFFIVSLEDGPLPVNGHGDRFSFIGNIKENNGSLHLSHVRLLDEGVYTCIITLYPSGGHKAKIPLTVFGIMNLSINGMLWISSPQIWSSVSRVLLVFPSYQVDVPPFISLKVEHPLLGNKEVTFASCMATGAKPPAEVSWHTGSLAESVRAVTNSTQHANGTTTTVSYLVGVPTSDVNRHSVQCVVKHPALTTEKTLPFLIDVYYAPMAVTINEAPKDVLECVSDANPKANYTWSRVSQPWPESAVKAEGGTLQFLSFTTDLNGLYLCEASNPYGRTVGYLYAHHTSGTCTTCWIILFLIVAVGAGFAGWYWYKYRYLPGRGEGMHEEQHHRPAPVPLEASPKESLRVEEEEDEEDEET